MVDPLQAILDELQTQLLQAWHAWYTDDPTDGDYYKWRTYSEKYKREAIENIMKLHPEINVQDSVQAKDSLSVWKRWFNGMKHFFTVKPLPPKKD